MAYNTISTTDKAQTSDSEHIELTVHEPIKNDDKNNKEKKENDIEIPMECQRNIFNLFLIANYRNDPRLNLKEHAQINQKIRYTLGAFAYLTAFVQWLAFIFLFMITILSSHKANFDWFYSASTTDWNLWMWPFWAIALIFAVKEGNESKTDMLILKNWNIKTETFWDCSCCYKNRCKTFQVFFFKVLTEKYFGYVASVGYFTVLAAHSNSEEWESALETIFRLIEFQFILETKVWAFSVFERPMKVWLAQTSDNFLDFDIEQLFEGEMTLERVKRKHSAHRSLPRSMWPHVYVIAVSFNIQAFYTNDLYIFNMCWWCVCFVAHMVFGCALSAEMKVFLLTKI